MWYFHAIYYYLAIKMNELIVLKYTAESQYVEQNMPDSKECMLYDSMYMKFKE